MNEQYITYEDYQKNCEAEEYNRACGNPFNGNRDEMLKKIKELQFSMIDLALYLDTHPNDKKAICMHREYANKYRRMTDEYQRMYGPLTIMFPCNKWRWLEEPWPWERGNF
jgi:spore coat protein JB